MWGTEHDLGFSESTDFWVRDKFLNFLLNIRFQQCRNVYLPAILRTREFQEVNPFRAGSKNLEKLVATILICVQVWSPLPLFGVDSAYISPAEAVLYSPDTKVPRSGELALRRAIPANPNMKSIQACHCLRRFQLVDFGEFDFLKWLVLVPLGFIGRYIIPSENSTKKALRYHGEQCKESSKGIQASE